MARVLTEEELKGILERSGLDLRKLYEASKSASERAYAPYSNFPVGSALAIRDPKGTLIIVTGANVENASYGLSICAERVAVFKAISEGYHPSRGYQWEMIAIYTPTESFTPPCGACRQVLSEFRGDIPIVVFNLRGEHKAYLLDDILPFQFKFKVK